MAVAPRVIENCCDLHFRFTTAHGERAENVYQFLYNATPSSGDMYAMATQWWANTGPNWRQFASNFVVPTEIHVVDLDNRHPMQTGTLPLGAGHQGTRGTDAEPGGAAAQMTLRTGFRGRSHKGRKSLSGFDSADQTNDTWQNQLMTWLAVYALDLLLDITVGGITFIPAIGSPKLHQALALLQALMPDPFVGSQKTRLPQHGSF